MRLLAMVPGTFLCFGLRAKRNLIISKIPPSCHVKPRLGRGHLLTRMHMVAQLPARATAIITTKIR